MTITWDMNDLKISYQNSKKMMNILELLKLFLGNINLTRGQLYDYLATWMVWLLMIQYVEEIINSFPEQIIVITPSQLEAIFFRWVMNRSPWVANSHTSSHHCSTTVSKWHSTKGHPNNNCILHNQSEEPRWRWFGKLIISFLYFTRIKHPKLSVGLVDIIWFYIDRSHATHGTCRWHSGGIMTLGKVAIINFSYKQKIKTKCQTRTRLREADLAYFRFNIS